MTFIQRVNTTGGNALSEPGAVDGEVEEVAYTAEYYFYRAENPPLSDRSQKWKRQRVAVSTPSVLRTRAPAVRSIGHFLATHLVFESIRK